VRDVIQSQDISGIWVYFRLHFHCSPSIR